MKYIKTYNDLNEGLRNKMKPKSEEEIISNYGNIHPDEMLVDGVIHGVFGLVKKAIEGGANLNRDWLLNKSILSGNSDVIIFLIENGVDIDNINHDYLSSLVDKIDNDIDIINIVKKLLEKGVDTNIFQSTLRSAILDNRIQLLEMLKENGIELEPSDKLYNVINVYVRKGEKDIINYLINNYEFIKNHVKLKIKKLNDELIKLNDELKKWESYDK